jgi:hypothetical protein
MTPGEATTGKMNGQTETSAAAAALGVSVAAAIVIVLVRGLMTADFFLMARIATTRNFGLFALECASLLQSRANEIVIGECS